MSCTIDFKITGYITLDAADSELAGQDVARLLDKAMSATIADEPNASLHFYITTSNPGGSRRD